MEQFIQKASNFLNAKFLLIIEPYKGSNIILQTVVLAVLVIGTLFLNRFIGASIKRNLVKDRKSSVGAAFYDTILQVYKALTIALILFFTTKVMQSMEINVPIIEQVYIVLFLWVGVKAASGMVKNKLFKKMLIVSAWILIGLNILNIYPDAVILLDNVAVTIAGVKISVYGIIRSIIYLIVIFKIATTLSAFTSQRIRGSEDLNPTLKALLSKAVAVVLFIFGTILFVNIMKINLGSLALFTSALGVGIGFGLQKIVANLISGVTLLVDKSLKPGDIIEVADKFGTVNVMGVSLYFN